MLTSKLKSHLKGARRDGCSFAPSAMCRKAAAPNWCPGPKLAIHKDHLSSPPYAHQA